MGRGQRDEQRRHEGDGACCAGIPRPHHELPGEDAGHRDLARRQQPGRPHVLGGAERALEGGFAQADPPAVPDDSLAIASLKPRSLTGSLNGPCGASAQSGSKKVALSKYYPFWLARRTARSRKCDDFTAADDEEVDPERGEERHTGLDRVVLVGLRNRMGGRLSTSRRGLK